MKLIRVKSTSLRSVGYDRRKHTLEVQFQQGRVYRYFDVPAETHTGLLKAGSAGAYFNRHIRPVYRYRRVVAEGPAQQPDK